MQHADRADKGLTTPASRDRARSRPPCGPTLWHNHRYSEDWDGTTAERTDTRSKDGVWYRGWEGVEQPNDLRTVSDIVVNVQRGTGNRIEFWDAHGMPFETEGKLRQYISLGRLSKTRGGNSTRSSLLSR